MGKRVSMPIKPAAQSAEEWVDDGVQQTTPENEERVPMKRMTFDIPPDLHRRIKVDCAKRGVTIADDLRDVLERTYPEL